MSEERETMFAQMRKNNIVDHINAKGYATVNELCAMFGVSPATIRYDLHDLEKSGLIERTHGGAMSNHKAAFEPDANQKTVHNVAEKERIARAALERINPGDSILLDTGSTMMQLAKLLGSMEKLTVVTTDVQIALWLETHTDVTVVLAGGLLRRHHHCTVGQDAIDMLSRLNVDKTFFATNGITVRGGLSTPNMEIAQVKAAMIQRARCGIVLCDSSKIGRDSFVTFAALSDVQTLITDKGAPCEFVTDARQLGLEVQLA